MKRALFGVAIAGFMGLSIIVPEHVGHAAPAAQAAILVPVVARVGNYSTNLSITNGTASPAALTLTYRYNLLASGARGTATRTVAVPGRATVRLQDVLGGLLGVADPSDGSIFIAGDTQKTIIATSLVSSAGTAALSAVTLSSPAIMRTSGAEQTKSPVGRSAASRTNLILTETGGGSAIVETKLLNAAGAIVSRRSYALTPYAYFQVNDMFGPSGFNMPAGDVSNMKLTAHVTSGTGAAEATTTVIDNASGAAQVSLLGATTGGESGIGIGR